MAKNLQSSRPLVNARSAAYARLASRVLEVLNGAVQSRRLDGETLSSIADNIGCHRSVLSRVLNGTVSNLTLKTISDILWATKFDPQDFGADPIEVICPNWVDDERMDYNNVVTAYSTKKVTLDQPDISKYHITMEKKTFELVTQ